MSIKSRPTRQRPGASSGTAARKPTGTKPKGTKPATGKTRSGENPFKKAAAGIQDTARAANANATTAYVKTADTAAGTAKSAARLASQATDSAQHQAFQFGKQFTQAGDWMRNQGSSFQNIWQQALQSVPAMASMGTAAFGKQDGARSNAAAQFGTNPMFGMDSSQFGRVGDNASRSMKELAALGSEHMQTMSECASTTAGVAKDMSQELLQAANNLFTDHMELTKAALSCRNMDDMMELQGKASRLAMETMFNESLRLSELAFKYAVDIAEPVQQSLASAGERMTKIVSKAA